MRYTSEQLTALINLRARGELSVQFGDRVIRYQTGADLDSAIAAARRDVALTTGAAQTRKLGEFGRGY
jgi:hypothetical protein